MVQRIPTLLQTLGLFILMSFMIWGCSEKQQFTAQTVVNSGNFNPITINTSESCSNFTLIKPQVDFLFIWDNSPSTTNITESTKKSLQRTLDMVSSRFDYHILVAPLIPASTPLADFNSFSLVIERPDGLQSTTYSDGVTRNPFSIVKPRENINFFTSNTGASQERGFLRARNIIEQNRSNGIFRNQAYTIVVMISNEDDDFPQSGPFPSPAEAENDFQAQKSGFLQLKNTMSSQMLRFMSIVAHDRLCEPDGVRYGQRYRRMSKELYTVSGYTDQGSKIWPDSYDICSSNFNDLFSGINESITDVVINHEYSFWPVASTTDPAFDPGEIRVFKNTGTELLSGDTDNGFVLLPGIQERDTRTGPSPIPGPGERFRGHLIQLFGNGRVTFPECLTVQTQTPAEYYGYFSLDRNPNLNSIEVYINGSLIPQSPSNGWEYIGFRNSQNIKIVGPVLNPGNPHQEAFPAMLKTGHIIKLNGSAIMSNGQSIIIRYKPGPI